MSAPDPLLSDRPLRSVLYIPGSKSRALEKARDLPADAIIFDLEDAVAPEEKPQARALLAETLRSHDYGARLRIVRINGFDSEWGREDVAAFASHPGVDALLLPKVNAPQDLDRVVAEAGGGAGGEASVEASVKAGVEAGGKPLWAMMETAQGMLNAASIAAHPRLQAMVMGTNDLAKELGCRFRADRLPLQTGLGLCLLAARAHGKLIIDGVFNAFRDEDGLRGECEQGRDMGFDGKTLIHPAQLQIANQAFAPSEAEIELSRRQIAAFEAAIAGGQGVAVLDGRIVENLHVESARRILARAELIRGLNA